MVPRWHGVLVVALWCSVRGCMAKPLPGKLLWPMGLGLGGGAECHKLGSSFHAGNQATNYGCGVVARAQAYSRCPLYMPCVASCTARCPGWEAATNY
jgi:hypothetical protein